MAQTDIICEYDGSVVSRPYCLACAARRTNPCGIPAELIAALLPDPKREHDVRIHVTELTGCVRQAVWKRTEEYAARPTDKLPALLGIAFHEVMGKVGGHFLDAVTEREFELPVLDAVVVGRPDCILPRERWMIDYKTVDKVPTHPHTNYVRQLNYYRLLVQQEYEIERLSLIYVSRRAVRQFDVPVWPERQTRLSLEHAVREYLQGVRGERLPPIPADIHRNFCKWCPFEQRCWREG